MATPKTPTTKKPDGSTQRNFSLALKTSLGTGIILIVVLACLVISAGLMASSSLKEVTSDKMTAIAGQNGITVQHIFNNAAGYANDLSFYLTEQYEIYNEMRANQETDENGILIPFDKEKSVVYDAEIDSFNQETEDYILYSLWAAVYNDQDVCGIGVFFEPYAFDSAVKDYTIYVSNDDAVAQSVQSYGAYESYGSQDYYTEALNTKSSVITDPYVDQGVTMITVAYPILSNNVAKGVIVVDLLVDNFSQLTSTDDDYATMYARIYSDTGLVIYSSESSVSTGDMLSSAIGTTEYNKISTQMAKGNAFTIETKNGSGDTISSFFYPVDAEGTTWWSATSLHEDDLNSATTLLIVTMLIMSIVAVLVLISFVTFFVRKMLKPIDGVVDAAAKIANGDLNVTLNATTNDEIGKLAASFAEMSATLRAIIKDMDHLLDEMAQGNFDIHTEAEEYYVGEYQGMLIALRNIISTLTGTIRRIDASSDNVNIGSDQVSTAAQALSQSSTEQAASVEELSASIRDVSEQIQQASENAHVANELTIQVGSGVRESNAKMQEVLNAMSDISAKSEEINKIIKTIDDIAFQTNILALNAAVEAARAGEAGKGFAVVADEVRNLAQKSAEAVKSTTVLIDDTTAAVGVGMKIADETAKYLDNIVASTNQTVENIQKIADAANDQATAIGQITIGVEQISSVIQTNAATAEESAAASGSLSDEAQTLKNLISKFRLASDR